MSYSANTSEQEMAGFVGGAEVIMRIIQEDFTTHITSAVVERALVLTQPIATRFASVATNFGVQTREKNIGSSKLDNSAKRNLKNLESELEHIAKKTASSHTSSLKNYMMI